jgi:predicted DNA-binding ribbon-helix-helix protein
LDEFSEAPDAPDDVDLPRLRIIQYDGRRYAIRIEPPFWAALEDAAEESGARLNRLIAALANHPRGPRNLAARLRIFAMKRTRRLARQSALRSGNVDLTSIAAAAPGPTIIFTDDRIIVFANEAAASWANTTVELLEGSPVAQLFRIRFKQPHSDPWRVLAAGDSGPFEGSIAYMPPGQLLVRPIRASRVTLDPDGAYACILFIS